MTGKFLILFIFLAALSHADEIVGSVEQSPRFVDLSRQSTFRAQQVQTLLHTSIASYGPNCWNSALFASGLTDSIHPSSPAEYWHWMNSPFCKVVPSGEALRYGDLGSVFSGDGKHYHSFMRMNDDLIFQKAGPESSHKWEMTKYEKIVFPEFHDIAARCKGNEDRQNSNNCDMHVVYHRCQPIPSDFYSRSDLENMESEIKIAERQLALWTQTHDPKQKSNYEAAIKKLGGLLDQLKQMRYSGEKEFARKALALRTAGDLTIDGNVPASNKEVKRSILLGDAYIKSNIPKDESIADVDRTDWRTFTISLRSPKALTHVSAATVSD